MIISTGDEMVSATEEPTLFQLRQSNGIAIKTVLERYKISADHLHVKDDFDRVFNTR